MQNQTPVTIVDLLSSVNADIHHATKKNLTLKALNANASELNAKLEQALKNESKYTSVVGDLSYMTEMLFDASKAVSFERFINILGITYKDLQAVNTKVKASRKLEQAKDKEQVLNSLNVGDIVLDGEENDISTDAYKIISFNDDYIVLGLVEDMEWEHEIHFIKFTDGSFTKLETGNKNKRLAEGVGLEFI